MRLNYHVTSRVWLQMEDVHTVLTPEESKAVIESMRDPGSFSCNLSCRPSGLNSNWIVHTQLLDEESIGYLVEQIGRALHEAMFDKQAGDWVPESSCGHDGSRCRRCSTWVYKDRPKFCDCSKKVKP